MKSEEKCTVTHSLWGKNGHLLLSWLARSPSAHTMNTLCVWVYSRVFMCVVHVVHVCACICGCVRACMDVCAHGCIFMYEGMCVHVYTYFYSQKYLLSLPA